MPTPSTTTHQRVPGASTVVVRGQRLRHLILAALERRRVLQYKQVGQRPEHQLAMPRMRLENWLRVNPTPSDDTVRRFPHVADIAVMLPANDEGVKRLDELRALMAP